jgi:tetratricopeptide (TPR) repeat protein
MAHAVHMPEDAFGPDDLPDGIYGFRSWLLWMIGTRAPEQLERLYDEGPANRRQLKGADWVADGHRVPTPSAVAWLLLAAKLGTPAEQLPRRDASVAREQHSLRTAVAEALKDPGRFRDEWLSTLAAVCSFSGAELTWLLDNRHDNFRTPEELEAEPAKLADAIEETLRARRESAPAPESADAGPATGPRTLPRAAQVFEGRGTQLRELAQAAEAPAVVGVVTICAIHGLPGIGKSTLAIRAAHGMAYKYPDGQYYLQLYGHTEGKQRSDAADALASLLQIAGFAPDNIPASLDARSALWRSHLHGKRVLLLLDNAAGPGQVRPLLPGTAGSLVLITSRKHLSGLEGARSLSLDTLTAEEAARLLVRLAARADLDPADAAVSEIVARCGRLPLAIELLASRLRERTTWTAAYLVGRLAEAQDRIGLMQAGDRSVAAAFDLSYADLTGDQQRLFRRLGLHPGSEIDAFAAAALEATDLVTASDQLDALYEQSLLTELAPGRYAMHDLIRQHSVGSAARDPAEELEAALGRLTDYYLRCSAAADAALGRQSRTRADAASTGPLPFALPDLSDGTRALDWIRAERGSLLALLDQARAAGQHAVVVALTAGIAALLRQDGPWAEARTRHATAIEAARRAEDQLGEANARCDLADIRYLTGDYHGAAREQRKALEIYRAIGDELGLANALTDLGLMQEHIGNYARALTLLEEARGTYQALGDRLGEAQVLSNIAVVREHTNEFGDAARALEQAQAIYSELELRQGQADTLVYLGGLLRLTGEYGTAAQYLEDARAIHISLGRRLGEANALAFLGAVHERAGDYESADRELNEALAIYDDMGQDLGKANARTFLAMVAEHAAEYARATRLLDSALKIYAEVDDPGGAAQARNVLGNVLRKNGQLVQAAAAHQKGLALAERIKSRWDAGHAHWGLGRCAREAGDLAGARDELRVARQIFEELGTPEVAEVKAELEALADP